MTQISAGWKETTLGEVCDIKGGKRLPKGGNLVSYQTKHPYIRITDMENNQIKKHQLQFIIDEVFENIQKYIVNTNDIILSIVGTIGLVAHIDEDLNNASLTENCVKFVNLKNLDSKFLYYFLISSNGQSEVLKNTVGAVQKKLPIYGVQNIRILFPELLPEQQAIAAVLSSFDDKIELLRAENQTLEQMGQELFKARFGKWKVGDELPAGWRVATDYIAFEKGVEVGSSNYYEKQNANFEFLPFYRVGDIASNGAISNIFCDKGLLKEKIFYTNDVLLSLDGTVGRVFIGGAGGYSSGIRKLVALNSEISQAFLYFWAKSEDVQKTISLYSEGTTIQHAGKSIPYLMISADIEKIKNSSKILNVRFDKILLNLEQIQSLSATRDQLLPKLMSGEVRVEF